MGRGCELDKRTVADGSAEQPGLNFPDKGIQFLSSSLGRECAALVFTHRPANWGRTCVGQMVVLAPEAPEEYYMGT